ncbi:MAG TPA: pitrilysin family protein, partial [Jatrophihabitantaceae bacterium]
MTSGRAVTRRIAASGGGEITRTVLPGGLRVVTEAMPGVRSLSVGVWVPVGSRDETPALAGTSHFLEHLLFKGTTTRSALDIASAMDAVGGEFNAFTEKEHTCFYATVLDRDLELAIDVVSDVVQHATVTAQDVDVERSVVLEEIAMRDDDPADLVFDEFSTALYGDDPLGRPILGSVTSITALRRAQVHG